MRKKSETVTSKEKKYWFDILIKHYEPKSFVFASPGNSGKLPKSAILLENDGSSWYVYLPPNAKGAAYKKFVEIFKLFSL